MHRHWLILLCLGLAACERREDGTKGRSEPARHTVDLPSMEQRIWGNEDDRKMREAAREDPERTLLWLYEERYLDAQAYETPLHCFLTVLLDESPDKTMALADGIEFDAYREHYLHTAYGMLARKDPAAAWAQWGKRRKAGKTDSPAVILSQTSRPENLQKTWRIYQDHAEGKGDAALFLAVTADGRASYDVDQLEFIATLLFSIPPDNELLPRAMAKAGGILAAADRSIFHSMLDRAPRHTNYDTGRSISAEEEMKHSEWEVAARSIAGILNREIREDLALRLRGKDGGDSEAVRKILPEMDSLRRIVPALGGAVSEGYTDGTR